MSTINNSINNQVGATFTPTVSGTPDLGSTSLMFGNLFLKSGGVINFNNGNVTLTQSAGLLTLGGSGATTLALGTNNITMTGSLGATGAGKLTKIWSVDGEFTNAPTVSGSAVYYVGGTDVAVTDGGTGLSTMTTAYGVVCAGTTATGNLQVLSALGSSGQVLTSNGAAALPSFQTVTGTVTWGVITGDQTAAVNSGYITNKAGTACVVTLPATAAVGSLFEVTGINATGWKIGQASGQTIHFGSSDSTTGTGGYIASTAARDSVKLVCVVANTDFNVLTAQGNITVA